MLRPMAALATIAVLAAGVAACGDDNESSGAAVAKAPEPVAQIDALGTLQLTPAPVGNGNITKQGVAQFPITGGNVTYYEPGTVSPFVQGKIDHAGSGLSLTGGGKTVELTDFVVDPGASVLTGKVAVDGEVAAESAPLFFLDGRTLEPLRTEGTTAILEGTTVKLKDEAATLLNDSFGTDALKGGLVIGVAKITVNTA